VDKKIEAGEPMIGKRIYEKKPGSSFSDTIRIKEKSAIFFNPDSLQVQKIKTGANGSLYETTAHDCFYQQKTAKAVLQTDWKKIRIVEDPHARFLVFVKENNSSFLIDLDKVQEMCGLIIFDPAKDPEFADMMNAATSLHFYFND
jgi:hypothetical protein